MNCWTAKRIIDNIKKINAPFHSNSWIFICYFFHKVNIPWLERVLYRPWPVASRCSLLWSFSSVERNSHYRHNSCTPSIELTFFNNFSTFSSRLVVHVLSMEISGQLSVVGLLKSCPNTCSSQEISCVSHRHSTYWFSKNERPLSARSPQTDSDPYPQQEK